jgi:antibiotic biosynthesis monooxygenase (ABM) superfamily enzyme
MLRRQFLGRAAAIIVAILYWVAMPLLTKLTRRWLYTEKRA